MATWDEIKAYLTRKYACTEVPEDGGLSFLFTWDGRTQAMTVGKYDDGRAGWLGLTSGVCALADLAPEQALRKNSTLSVGSLALAEAEYVLTYGVPLAFVDDMDMLDYLLSVFATQADGLEAELSAEDAR